MTIWNVGHLHQHFELTSKKPLNFQIKFVTSMGRDMYDETVNFNTHTHIYACIDVMELQLLVYREPYLKLHK